MPDEGAYRAVRSLPSRGASTLEVAEAPGVGGTVLVREFAPSEAWDAGTIGRETEAFLRSAELQRELADADARGKWAKVHEIDRGMVRSVSDHYERSVEWLLDRRVPLDTNSLRNIADSALAGLGQLRKVKSRGHGNLKPSNILIGGADSIAGSEVVLCDPLPGDGVGARAAQERDLQRLGAMLYELITHQRFNEVDHYPVLSGTLDGYLGKKAEAWRVALNKLLTPDAPATAERIDEVRADLRRTKTVARKWVASGAVAAVLAIVAVVFVVVRSGKDVVRATPQEWQRLCMEYKVWADDFNRFLGNQKPNGAFGEFKGQLDPTPRSISGQFTADYATLAMAWDDKYAVQAGAVLQRLEKVRTAIVDWPVKGQLKKISEEVKPLSHLAEPWLADLELPDLKGGGAAAASDDTVGRRLSDAIGRLDGHRDGITSVVEGWGALKASLVTLEGPAKLPEGKVFADFATYADDRLRKATDFTSAAKALSELSPVASQLAGKSALDLDLEGLAAAVGAEGTEQERFTRWIEQADRFKRATKEQLAALEAKRKTLEERAGKSRQTVAEQLAKDKSGVPLARDVVKLLDEQVAMLRGFKAPLHAIDVPTKESELATSEATVGQLEGEFEQWVVRVTRDLKEGLAKLRAMPGLGHAELQKAWEAAKASKTDETYDTLLFLEGRRKFLDALAVEVAGFEQGVPGRWTPELKQDAIAIREDAVKAVCSGLSNAPTPGDAKSVWGAQLTRSGFDKLLADVGGFYDRMEKIRRHVEAHYLPHEVSPLAGGPAMALLPPEGDRIAAKAGAEWANLKRRVDEVNRTLAQGERRLLLATVLGTEDEAVRAAAWRKRVAGNVPAASMEHYAQELDVLKRDAEIVAKLPPEVRATIPKVEDRPRTVWLEYFPLARNADEVDRMFADARAMNVAPEQLEGRGKLNYTIWSLGRQLGALKEGDEAGEKAMEPAVRAFVSEVKAMGQNAALKELMDEIEEAVRGAGKPDPRRGPGPNRVGWQLTKLSEEWIRYSVPGQGASVEFRIVKVGPRSIWLSTSEVSRGLFIGGMKYLAENGPNARDADPYRPFRTMGRLQDGRLSVWAPEQNAKLAPVRAREGEWGVDAGPLKPPGERSKYYSSTGAPPAGPTDDSPMQYLPFVLANEFAISVARCRLPTVEEWQSAVRQELAARRASAADLLKTSNLRDRTWVDHLKFVIVRRTQPETRDLQGRYPLPDVQSYDYRSGHDRVETVWSFGGGQYDDNMLWPAAVAPRGNDSIAFHHLFGNVAEFVTTRAYDEKGTKNFKLDEAKVIGASAMSTPENSKPDNVMEPKKLASVLDLAQGFVDVGFRLAFDAAPRSMVAVAKEGLAKGPYLLAAR